MTSEIEERTTDATSIRRGGDKVDKLKIGSRIVDLRCDGKSWEEIDVIINKELDDRGESINKMTLFNWWANQREELKVIVQKKRDERYLGMLEDIKQKGPKLRNEIAGELKELATLGIEKKDLTPKQRKDISAIHGKRLSVQKSAEDLLGLGGSGRGPNVNVQVNIDLSDIVAKKLGVSPGDGEGDGGEEEAQPIDVEVQDADS